MFIYVYAMGMLFYVLAGAVALPPCLLLALVPFTRSAGLPLTGGIIGSYVGVVAFQLLSMPLLLVSFALFWLASLFPMDRVADCAWNALLVLVIMAWMG